MNRTAALLLVSSLCLSTLVLFPTATAHDCTVEEGEPLQSSCEKECKDGESHNHTVNHTHDNPWNPFDEPYNHVHYDCHSVPAGTPPPEPKCTYNRVEFPQLVCDVAGDALDLSTLPEPFVLPDPMDLAGMAVRAVGGALGAVDTDIDCPAMTTPDPDSIEYKPGEPPEAPTYC